MEGRCCFVLNQIEKLNQSDKDNRFTGRMDTSRIGMFGHSYGGATVAQVLVEDSRVKATINMDGTLYGENVPKSRVGKPFLIMNAETSDDSTKDFLEEKFVVTMHLQVVACQWLFPIPIIRVSLIFICSLLCYEA